MDGINSSCHEAALEGLLNLEDDSMELEQTVDYDPTINFCESKKVSRRRRRSSLSEQEPGLENPVTNLDDDNLYRFELLLNSDPDLTNVQKRNLILLEKSSHKLTQFDFWSTLDSYNYSARKPVLPGSDYFIKELGPFVASKTIYAENCHGCGSLIDEKEYCFWHAREVAFVDFHYCQLCVAYVLYHLQILDEKPPTPVDLRHALDQCLRAKYPKFYAQRFPDVSPDTLI